tara:strand:- start:1164 stop:1697 length:534 start_codon:yes stop_codon:yes gene_type:complete
MKNLYKNPFVHTWTGKKFYFLNPSADDVCIEDIAHALSLQCRFNGHIAEHYSVAEHCIIVAETVQAKVDDPKVVLAALIHDAAEAYLGDVVSPLKSLLPEYKKYERAVDECIANKFSLSYPYSGIVCKADKIVLEREFSFLAPFVEEGVHRKLMSAKVAEKNYLDFYYRLKERIEDE